MVKDSIKVKRPEAIRPKKRETRSSKKIRKWSLSQKLGLKQREIDPQNVAMINGAFYEAIKVGQTLRYKQLTHTQIIRVMQIERERKLTMGVMDPNQSTGTQGNENMIELPDDIGLHAPSGGKTQGHKDMEPSEVIDGVPLYAAGGGDVNQKAQGDKDMEVELLPEAGPFRAPGGGGVEELPVKTRADFGSDDAYIEHLASTIDHNDLQSILNFAAVPSEKLAVIAKSIREETKADTDLISRLEQLPQAIKEGNIDKLKEAIADFKLASAKNTNRMRKMMNTLRGLTVSSTRKKVELAVQGSVDSIDLTVDTLKSIERKLPGHIQRIASLEEAIVANGEDIEFHIAALNRVIEKLENKTIPELKAKIEQSEENGMGSTRDMNALQKLENFAMQSLYRKRESLISGQAIKQIALTQMHAQHEVLATIAMKTKDHLNHSRAMWELQGAVAQGVVFNSQMMDGIESADELGNEMLEGTTELAHIAIADSRRAGEKSLVDPEKVVLALESFSQDLEVTAQDSRSLSLQFKERADKISAKMAEFQENRKQMALEPPTAVNDNEPTEPTVDQTLNGPAA